MTTSQTSVRLRQLPEGRRGLSRSVNKVWAVVTALAVALLILAFRPFISPAPASAQSGTYGFLVPQAGNTEIGGKEFIDMRNGKDYACTYTDCKEYGQFAFAKIK